MLAREGVEGRILCLSESAPKEVCSKVITLMVIIIIILLSKTVVVR